MITISCSSRYKIERKKIKAAVSSIFVEKQISPAYDINIIFVGRNKMKKISQTYKHEPEALPVLSFPYRQEKPPKPSRFDKFNEDKTSKVEVNTLLGEIFICYPQVVLLAAERNRKVEETIINLIKHGLDNLTKS